MKKISVKKIAYSLFEVIQGKNPEEVKIIISRFVKMLDKNLMLGKFHLIIYEFDEIWNDNKGILTAEVVSNFKLSKDIIEDIKNNLKNITKFQEVIIKQNIDKNILGGLTIKYKDKIFDASLKSKLDYLKRLLNN